MVFSLFIFWYSGHKSLVWSKRNVFGAFKVGLRRNQCSRELKEYMHGCTHSHVDFCSSKSTVNDRVEVCGLSCKLHGHLQNFLGSVCNNTPAGRVTRRACF